VLESEGEEEEEVVQGLTSHMEMCDFFLFFWTDISGLTLAQVQTRDGRCCYITVDPGTPAT
jgi:hypothetical protein